MDRLLGAEWVGAGAYLGRKQEAFDAELAAVRVALSSLTAQQTRGEEFTLFTDSPG